MDLHQILKWWPLIVVGGLGLMGYASMQTQIADLKDRVDKLENRVDPLRTLKVGKGDLCLKMLEQLGTARGDAQKRVQRQWDAEGCEEMPAHASTRGLADDNSAIWENAVRNVSANAD